MGKLEEIFAMVSSVIDVLGILILLLGLVRLIYKYLISEIKHFTVFDFRKIQRIRCEMASYILLALDFLIASDIIQTMIQTEIQKIIQLGVLIILRTGIAYFLGKEINEIENHTNQGKVQ